MVKADFVTGLAFFILGIVTLIESLRMPTFEHLGVNPYSAPGVVPGALGVIIALLGGVLAVRAARAGGFRLGAESGGPASLWRQPPVRRFGLAFVLTFVYAAGLVGTLPFWLATGLFVFTFIVAFEWSAHETLKARMRGLAIAGAEAVLVAAGVTFVFRELFLVTLP